MDSENGFDYKKSWAEMNKGMAFAIVETARQGNIEHFKAIVEYSKMAINGTFLLNGMAGIAIVYNMEKLGTTGFTTLMFCAIGAVFAVLCSGVSYLAQKAYSKFESEYSSKRITYYFDAVLEIMAIGKTDKTPPEASRPIWGYILNIIACALWFFSVVFFLFAIYLSFPKFQSTFSAC